MRLLIISDQIYNFLIVGLLRKLARLIIYRRRDVQLKLYWLANIELLEVFSIKVYFRYVGFNCRVGCPIWQLQ